MRAAASTGEISRPSGREAATESTMGRCTATSHWAEPSTVSFTPRRPASSWAAQAMVM